MTRTVLETMRTLFVWIGGLALYYSSGTGQIGERWQGKYSWAQVTHLPHESSGATLPAASGEHTYPSAVSLACTG